MGHPCNKANAMQAPSVAMAAASRGHWHQSPQAASWEPQPHLESLEHLQYTLTLCSCCWWASLLESYIGHSTLHTQLGPHSGLQESQGCGADAGGRPAGS